MTRIDDSPSDGGERERTTMDDPTGATDDPTVRREEDAAAAEAGGIGGVAPGEGGDEADRPVAEAGGGEAEGFEQSEDALMEQASHGEDRFDPEDNAFAGEAESDRSGAEYSEPDQVDIEDRGQ